MRKFKINEKREGEMAICSLSEKAQKVYNTTDPLNVYGRDGRYFIRGAFGDHEDMTLSELEEKLEGFAEEE